MQVVDINGNMFGPGFIVIHGPDGKIKTLTGGGGGVSAVTATLPLASSGGATPNISMPAATALVSGYLTNLDWVTFNSKQDPISLTTVGSSGAATFGSNVLNIPVYSLSGLGGVPLTRTLTINGTSFDLSADRSWSVGTVTSVGFTAGTGIGLSGTNPITGTGTIVITNTAPDQTVVINAGANISVTGTYPNFTVAYTGSSTKIWTDFTEVNLPVSSTGVNALATVTIPANTFQNGDGILVRQRLRRNTGTNSTCSMGIYVNNANTLVGAALLASTTLATTNPIGQMKRDFFVRGATTHGYVTSSNIASDDILTTVQGVSSSIDWTVTQYLFFTANPASASDSFIFLGYYIMRLRP